MKFSATLLAVAIATAGLSCASSQVSTSDALPSQTPGQAISPSSTGAAHSAPKAAANVSSIDGDVPPLDARFHLFCDDIAGPNHIARAGQLKAQLTETYPGMRGWHIIHTEEKSSLYYGYYRTISKEDPKIDPQEVARAHADLQWINQLKNAQGDKLFRNPMFLLLSDADPAAPAQWNLANAPADAYWSLQICAYRGQALPGTPDRKQCAVDTVRQLRATGVEAYYYQGETISSVCVGAWPREAVKEQDSSTARTLRSDDRILVFGDVLPPNVNTDLTDKEGHKVVVQAPKLEILDRTMADMVTRYPNHYINGELFGTRPKTGPPVPDRSFLVLVPHGQSAPLPQAKGNAVQNAGRTDSIDQAANAITGDPAPATPPAQVPGRGRLPSLEQP